MNTMQSIKAISLAPDVNEWLANSRQPRILHVFDQACNLINEHREVLSIVTPQIGNGPFNLVVEDKILFSEHLNVESPVFILDNRITLGNLTNDTANAELWNPCPNWEKLHDKREEIFNQLLLLPIPDHEPTLHRSLLTTFSIALANSDISSVTTAAKHLAGLGIGLTPAGDDFILGAILAAWIIHPLEVASVLVKEVSNMAAPLTTSLSAAYLRSAGRGETGILWHNFFDALTSGDSSAVEPRISELLSIGETSGADAFAGFIGTFISYAEIEKNHVIPKHL